VEGADFRAASMISGGIWTMSFVIAAFDPMAFLKISLPRLDSTRIPMEDKIFKASEWIRPF
jgi:hypothetical protein